MPLPETAVQARQPWTAAIVGLGIALLALLLAEFFSVTHGHRIDFDKLPPEVQAILTEQKDGAISPDQWRRAEKALRPYGGWGFGQKPYWAQTVVAGWQWFVVLPLTALGLAAARRALSTLKALWILSPSLLLLASAMASLSYGS
jgi:hypothetical protein